MSLQYKVVKQSFGFDETKTEKYVVRTVTGEMLPFDRVCKQVSQICGVHRGVTTLVLGGLLDVMVNNLDMGHSVQLGDFGSLRPGLRTKAQDSEETANASAIYRRKINFVPGKMLKNFLKDVPITRAVMSKGIDNDDDGGGFEDPNA